MRTTFIKIVDKGETQTIDDNFNDDLVITDEDTWSKKNNRDRKLTEISEENTAQNTTVSVTSSLFDAKNYMFPDMGTPKKDRKIQNLDMLDAGIDLYKRKFKSSMNVPVKKDFPSIRASKKKPFVIKPS